MFKRVIFCLAVSQIHVVISQCVNRVPPNFVFNRPVQETIETINSIPLQQTVIEAPSLHVMQPHLPVAQPHLPVAQPHLPVMQPHLPVVQPHLPVVQPHLSVAQPHLSVVQPYLPSPTTIITDCTPSVCKNIINTLQLMIACNLIKNKGRPDLTDEFVKPIIGELLSSSGLPYCQRGFLNPVTSNIPANLFSSNIKPGAIASSNILPGPLYPASMAPAGVAALDNNPRLGSLFHILK